jgi:hypothetical protein
MPIEEFGLDKDIKQGVITESGEVVLNRERRYEDDEAAYVILLNF